MPLRWSLVIVAVAGLGALAWGGGPGVKDRHPVYVGARVCTECHTGPRRGHQFSLWRTSAHARAYASLWSPVAKKITELSGIPEEPQEAAMCLGCHATAYDAEAWEKEDTFFLEDGVQCELCHGPGSEYMAKDIMMNPSKAMMNGLMMPDETGCMRCHNVKGSHVAYLGSANFDAMQAKKMIAHPVPERTGAAAPQEDVSAKAVGDPGGGSYKYAGVMGCARCHRGPMMGYQFSKWRLSGHARAYAGRSTTKGRACIRAAGAATLRARAATPAASARGSTSPTVSSAKAVTARAASIRRKPSCATGAPPGRPACAR